MKKVTRDAILNKWFEIEPENIMETDTASVLRLMKELDINASEYNLQLAKKVIKKEVNDYLTECEEIDRVFIETTYDMSVEEYRNTFGNANPFTMLGDIPGMRG